VNETLPYQLLADAVLALHVAIVVFVVGGLVVIVIGNLRAWPWVNAAWFRLSHLIAIAVVVAEAWLGTVCPLTSLEMSLREKARATTYAGSFVEHWLQRILYYDAPAWVFTLGYSLFALAVVATWWYFPPRFRRRANETTA
jgi:polyferredoxin